MRFKRSYVLLAGGAAACVAVAGCGSTGHSAVAGPAKPAGNVILTAYTDSLAAKSAKITLHETISGSTGQQVALTGSGVVDLGGQEGELRFTVPGVGTIQTVIRSPELYLELPAKERAGIPGGKPWVSLNLDEITKAKLGASLSQLSSSSQSPSQTLGYLQSVSSTVEKVGTPQLGGVATTEYSASVDLSKVAASKSAAVKSAVAKIEGTLHSETLPVKVWIDGQHHVRQMAYDITVPEASGRKVAVSTTIGLSSYGTPVTTAIPPASQTYDATGAALGAGTTSS